MNRMTTIALSTVLLTSSAFASAQQDWKGESLDAWIDGKVETTLLLNTELNSFDINTDVENGIVTLTGDVNNNLEKSLAEEIVLSLDGVKEVKNELVILDKAAAISINGKNLTASKETAIKTTLTNRWLMS